MIANMMIANNTNKPIWSSGAIALMMDFSTTCRPIRGEKNIQGVYVLLARRSIASNKLI